MKRMILAFALLAAVGRLGAAEQKIDFAKVAYGSVAPVLNGDELSFEAPGAAARLPGVFDLTRGIRIELEFLDSGKQTNPYARLLEIPGLSLQFNNRAGSQIKVFSSPVPGKHAQAIVTVKPQPGAWRRAVVTLEPTNRLLSIRIDDAPELFAATPLTTDISRVTAGVLVLGAEKLNGSQRSFSGKLRNLMITAPYDPAPRRELTRSTEPLRINGEPVRYARVAATAGLHYAFPGLTRLADGDLMVVFREGVGHICPYGRHTACYSKDNGKTWSAPRVINDTAADDRDPSVRQLPDGRLLLAYFRNNAWISSMSGKFEQERAFVRQAGTASDGGRFFRFSEDGGQTWGPEVKVPVFTPHGPILYQGALLCPVSLSRDGRRYIDFYRGTPDGQSWERIGVVAHTVDDKLLAYQEPYTVALPDGTLLTALRVTSDGYMRTSRSTDGGKTWSEPEKSAVRGFPQHLLVLKDGRLLATYGYRFHPYGIRGCISKDGGKTWDLDNELIIRDNGQNVDLGYPESIELADGEVMTVYYHNSPDFAGCHIEVAVYKP